MQVQLRNGVARIKLTQSEKRKLEGALEILQGIAKFEPLHVAADEVSLVLKRIGEDGVYVPPAEGKDDA